MTLRRAGATTFAAGLLVCPVAAVTLGVVSGGTDAFCEGPRRLAEFALLGVGGRPPTLVYTDGCNEFTARPLVAWSGALAALGLVVAAVGQATDR